MFETIDTAANAIMLRTFFKAAAEQSKAHAVFVACIKEANLSSWKDWHGQTTGRGDFTAAANPVRACRGSLRAAVARKAQPNSTNLRSANPSEAIIILARKIRLF